jgi:hypothetical protein
MRYFRYMFSDNFLGLDRHDSGYLVNRKPVVTKFTQPRNTQRVKAASTRMGIRFLKKLDRMGL